jgi:hypothetical protein
VNDDIPVQGRTFRQFITLRNGSDTMETYTLFLFQA